jgi:hypothetical protein
VTDATRATTLSQRQTNAAAFDQTASPVFNMGAMVTRLQRQLKMPRPAAYSPSIMPSFQLVGLPSEPFEALFGLSDAQPASLHAKPVVATEKPGYPCRVSLVGADVGEELFLMPYMHQAVDSPYKASGPIFVRRGAKQRILEPNEIPQYVSHRLISLRAYDSAHMMVDAAVCEGQGIIPEIQWLFSDARVQYVHLHNAKRGCFSCLVVRA